MADFNKPVTTDLFANVLTYIRDARADVATWIDSRRTAPTNLPDYAKRWNNSAKTFENWLSSTWATIVLSVAGGGTGADNPTDARANLGAASYTELYNHEQETGAQNVHQSTSAATANAIVRRDGAGRAKVAAPSAADDVARLQEITDHAAITAAHGATSAPTASRMIIRDSAGRAQVAMPASVSDIALYQNIVDHAGNPAVHLATVGASGSRIAMRDASGRAQFADPAAAADAATKGYVDAAIPSLMPKVCRLYKSADQNTTPNFRNHITWDMETVDSQEAHAGSSEYIVVPTGFTWIRIDACLFSLSTPYVFFAYISKNGTDFAGPFSMYIQSGNSSSLLMTTGWFPTVAGDTYHLEAFEMIGNHPVIGGATKSFFAAEFR